MGAERVDGLTVVELTALSTDGALMRIFLATRWPEGQVLARNKGAEYGFLAPIPLGPAFRAVALGVTARRRLSVKVSVAGLAMHLQTAGPPVTVAPFSVVRGRLSQSDPDLAECLRVSAGMSSARRGIVKIGGESVTFCIEPGPWSLTICRGECVFRHAVTATVAFDGSRPSYFERIIDGPSFLVLENGSRKPFR